MAANNKYVVDSNIVFWVKMFWKIIMFKKIGDYIFTFYITNLDASNLPLYTA